MPDAPGASVDQPLPDVIGPGLAVLVCGINPGASSAASGHSFMRRSNRFRRVMHLAGFTPLQLAPQEDQSLLDYGCGLTAAVGRPTRRAGELSREELPQAVAPPQLKVLHYAPRTLAFLGKAAYGAVASRREIAWGLQLEASPTPASGCCPIPAASIAASASTPWRGLCGVAQTR